MLRCSAKVTVVMLLLAAACPGEVVGWRTDGSGRYDGATPPLQWSTTQNVLWHAKLPATGNATPVVVGDRIFVTAEPFLLLCLSAADGRELWRADHGALELLPPEEAAALRAKLAAAKGQITELQDLQNQRNRLERKLRSNPDDADAKQRSTQMSQRIDELAAAVGPLRDFEPPRTHGSNGYATPTPVSDGAHVFAHFGNGVAAAYTLDGRRKWIRLVERPEHEWGHSSSPTLAGGTLVVLVKQLHGLDPATGDTRWTTPSRQRWGSPVPVQLGDTAAVVTPHGELVRVADGHVLARDLGKLEYATPLVVGDTIYFIENTSRAVRVTLQGDTAAAAPLWTAKVEGDRHYASPLLHDGLLYTISRKEHLTVLDAASGAIVHERGMNLDGNMPNSAYPSLALAGGKLFVASESGQAAVLVPGKEATELHRNQTTGFRASPVFVGDRLYLRCFDGLYCFSATATAQR